MPLMVMPKRYVWFSVTLQILFALFLFGSALATAAPANDNFAEATLIPARPQLISGSSVGSTVEPGEVNGNSYPNHSVWYKWIPSESGGWEVSFTSPSNGDAILVFTGSSFQTFKQAGFVSWDSSNSLWVDAG